MSDAFHKVVRFFGRHVFWASSRPVVLHVERTDREGPFILAANHHSPYDVPLMMRHATRMLDFVSIVEVFRNPFVAWFYGSMNAFPLDRSKPDSPTVRIILDRLERGRAIAMFPEGGFRRLEDSVVTGGRMRPGVGRIAQMANVPVVPCVVVGSNVYARVSSWLPIRRARYGITFGEPLTIDQSLDKAAGASLLEDQLREAFMRLYEDLRTVIIQRDSPAE